jgi:hypothetical protein
MSVIAFALSLWAAQAPAPGAGQIPAASSTPPAPPEAEGPPPTIESLLAPPPIDEDARQAAVRAAYDAAQARRGPLDGPWRLSATGGGTLYIFQFSDPGQTPDPRSITPNAPVVEGAWRDPRRGGVPGGSGFLTNVRRDGADLLVRFYDRDPGRAQVVTLHARPGGDWAGVLEGEAPARPVVMTRF